MALDYYLKKAEEIDKKSGVIASESTTVNSKSKGKTTNSATNTTSSSKTNTAQNQSLDYYLKKAQQIDAKRSTPVGGSAVGQNKYLEMLDRNNADAQANSMRQPTRTEYNAQKLKKQAADQAKWRTKYSGYSFKELEKALDDISDINEKQWVEDYMMSDESGSTGLQRLYHNVKKGLTGALKSGAEGTLASNVNTMATNYEMGQKTRSEMNTMYLNDAKDTLAQAEKEYELMLEDNRNKPGSYSDKELKMQLNIINDAKSKIAAFETAETAQKEATQATYKIADTVQEKATKTLEDSTKYMGEVGKILTEGASSSVQSGLDFATNMILGMKPNYIPFAMRAFGSSTQQARQQGASLEQQIAYGAASTAKEILTEMIFDVNVLQQKAYGKNIRLSADDLVRKAIDKAVKNIDNKALKAITDGAMHLGSSMVSEGLEELIGDWIEWQLPRIYNGEVDSAQETLTKSLNDFLVGAAAGLTGDASGTIINAPINAIKESSLGNKVQKAGLTEAIIETGLANDPNMKSYQRAAEIQKKQEQGKKLRSGEIGRLYIDTLNDIEEAKKENSDLPEEPKKITLKTAEEAMKGDNTDGGTGRDLLHDGSMGRNTGESAGEQARRMAEGSGSIESRQGYRADTGARAAEARGITENLRIQPVSSRSIGFGNGTDTATMSFIPTENETAWMKKTRQRVKDDIGTEVRYYTGQMQIAANNKRGYVTPNAAIKNGIMYLQADNAKWSVEQLAAHESFHELVRQNRELYTSTQNKILSKYNAQSFMGVMNSYMKNLSSMNYTADQIVEEIFADAYAEMNAFDAGATEYSDTVRETVNEVRKPTQAAAATEETTGPPSREVVKQRVEQLRQDLSEGKITEAEFDEQYDLLSQEENWQDKENFSVSRIEDPEQKKKVVNQLRKYMNGSMSLDELRGYINGAADNTNTQTENAGSSEADEIIRAARKRGMSAREYVNENWDYYEQDGRPNAAAQEAIRREGARFSISQDLEDDLNSVLNNTFPANESEVIIGDTSDFLVNTIGADPLKVTMIPSKAYANMVSEERARQERRYRSDLNYHNLGPKGLIEILKASEEPVAAFADYPDADGNERLSRIVLVTDKKIDGNYAVVIAEMNSRGLIGKKRVDVNKDITVFDRKTAGRDILEADADHRLLFLDKKRSQKILAGVPAANSPTAIRDFDFEDNIRQFWSNVKGLNGKTSADVETDSPMVIALRKAGLLNDNETTDTSKEDESFSLTEPVEETDRLIAWHNMDEEALRSALELGGLAMPSWAIKTADKGHNTYGDFSLIAPRDLVDPKANRSSMIFGGDAWTPTFPTIDYKVTYESAAKLRHEIESLVGGREIYSQLRGASLDEDNISDQLRRSNGDIGNYYKNNTGLEYAYLKDIGEDIDLPMKEKEFSQTISNASIQKFANMLTNGLQTVDYYQNKGVTELLDDEELCSKIAEILNDEILSEHEPGSKAYEALKKAPIYKAEEIKFTTIDNMLTGARKYLTYGHQQTVDENALSNEIEKRIDKEAYKKWITDKLYSTVEKKGIRNNVDLFTPAGNRRGFDALHYDYNLANVVKAMKSQSKQGNVQFLSGSGSVKGAALKKYGDIESVRADRSRLVATEDEAKEAYDTYNEHLTDILDRMTRGRQADYFSAADAIIETLQKTKTKDGIARYMNRELKDWYNVTEDITDDIYNLIEEINQLPMEYFEGKTYDAVSFDELAAIVAPSDADPLLISALKNAGTNVLTYEAGNNADRLAKVNSVENSKFSITEETDEDIPQGMTLPTTDITRETLTAKARNALKDAERRLSTKTARALEIPTRGVRDVLTPEIQKLSDEYLRSGRISDDSINNAFETAYEQGIIVDDQFLKDFKHVKDYLRKQGITINEYDTHDIPDYGAFRKSLFGTMKIVKDGLPIDTAYRELRGMAPELFPDSITAPSDMLLHMADVAKQIRASEKSLDEYYGSEAKIFKEYAKHDFIDAVNSMIPDLRSIKTYAEAKAAPQEEPITTLEQAKEAWTKLKDARKTYEKAAAKNLLSERDEMQVGRLLRGEILLEDLDGSRDNIRGITAVYEAKQEYEKLSQTLRTYKAQRRKALDTVADEFLKNASFWKDKKAGIEYARETQERNIEDIVRDAKGNLDSKTAKAIQEYYFAPVHKANAESNRYQNAMRDRVKKLDLSRKVENGNLVSEAHATQLLGEALDNIQMLEKSKGRITERDGKSLSDWRGVVQELYKSNPNMDFEKINKAIEEFRKIYDEIFERMNEVRVLNGYEPINYRHGYFPHFQPGQDGIFGVFSNVLGISADVTALPTSINGLTHTFKPGITWFGNAQERLGFNTAYDAVEGFDKYISGAADVIFQTENIQRLRSFARRIRYNTTDEGIKQKVDRILQDPTLNEADKQNRIDKIYEDGKFTLSNYIVDLEEYTNLLANKKSRADRNMEQALGRKWFNISKRFESLVAANMVGMNVGSWLTNFIPLTQGGAMIGKGQMLKAMKDTLASYVKDDGFVDKSTFLTNRRGTDAIVRSWDQSISSVIGAPMEYIDRFTADTLVRARYAQNVNQGMSEQAAMDEADVFAASVMADRSKGSTPTLFSRHNPLTKLVTQFQLEVNNQLSYLFKDMPRMTRDKGKKALAAALLKFFIGAFLYNEVYEFFIGRRAALDPIGILNETSGDVFGYELPNLIELGVGAIKGEAPSLKTEKTSLYEAGVNLGENVLEEMPFTSALALLGLDIDAGRLPVASAIPDLSAIKTYLDPEVSKEKKLNKAKTELYKGLYLLPTGGGGQIKKAIQGIGAVVKGGSFTVDNNGNDILQYPVYAENGGQKAWYLAKGAVFGKSSLPLYDDWVDSNFKNLSANETITYEEMVEAGSDGNKLFDFIREIKKFSNQADKANAIIESDFSKDEKIALTDFLIGKRVTDNGKLTDRFETETDSGNDNQYAKFHKALDAGVSVDDCLRTIASGGKLDKITEAKEAGLDIKQYDDLKEKEISLEKYEDIKDAGLTVDEYVKLRDKDISIKQYTEKIDDGFSKQGAVKIIEAMDGVGSKNADRYAAIKNAGLSADDFETAVRNQLGSDEYKIDVADSYGIDTTEYVDFQVMLPKYDEDNNGSYRQKEIENALRATSGMTNEERAALWQIQSGSTSAKNNPFDTSIGQAVINALKASKPK